MSNDAVVDLSGGIRLSLSALSREFEMSRETIHNKLIKAGVTPDGERNGWPVYRLRQAADALIRPDLNLAEELDPDRLPPTEMRAYWQGLAAKQDAIAKERKNDLDNRLLIPAGEVESGIAKAFKCVILALTTLPDVLERDAGISGDVVEKVMFILDETRTEMADALSSLADGMNGDADSRED